VRQREIADTLGVGQATVQRDLGEPNESPEPEPDACEEAAPAPNDAPAPEAFAWGDEAEPGDDQYTEVGPNGLSISQTEAADFLKVSGSKPLGNRPPLW